jgi:hypothetical protein
MTVYSSPLKNAKELSMCLYIYAHHFHLQCQRVFGKYLCNKKLILHGSNMEHLHTLQSHYQSENYPLILTTTQTEISLVILQFQNLKIAQTYGFCIFEIESKHLNSPQW